MKRLLDILIAIFGLIVASPVLVPLIVAVWLQDFRSPFYIATRVGKDGRRFRLVKLRSMVVDADKSGVSSTSATDARITPLGRFIRRYKLDELTQLWNVLIGDMSLVGPRPNVEAGVAVYTPLELKLLSVTPGITDISSIVFSDEEEILRDSKDPDKDYDRLIRPWKSRLGLLYIEKQNVILDLKLIFATAVAIFSKPRALRIVQSILCELNADETLKGVCARTAPLYEIPPPTENQKLASNAGF